MPGVLNACSMYSPNRFQARGAERCVSRITPALASCSTLDRAAAHQADGHTTVTVRRIYELGQAADALGDFTSATLGKLVIAID